MRAHIAIGLVTATALALTACSSEGDGTAAREPSPGADSDIRVVVTTTPLGSITEQIATCAGGTSTTLMPVGADPHDFAASSSQVADMVKADLVIANGLSLEGGLDASLRQVEEDGTDVLHVAEEVDPLEFGAHGDEHGDHDGHDHGHFDPHFWLDAGRMAKAASVIGHAIAERSGDVAWGDCGDEVSVELQELDGEIQETLSVVPADRRTIVTDHEALAYFNKAYGFESAGVVVPGGSTEAQPSSRELAALADTVRAEKVPAIFANSAVNQGLVDALAAEVGSEVKVVPLYIGSVGEPGSAARDYQGMMRENARLIAEALG